MDVNLKASQFEWDTFDGEVQGIYGNLDWEIYISARVTSKDVRWGAEETNVRTWVVSDEKNNTVASGQADGVRACKKDALAALNEHIDELVFRSKVNHFKASRGAN